MSIALHSSDIVIAHPATQTDRRTPSSSTVSAPISSHSISSQQAPLSAYLFPLPPPHLDKKANPKPPGYMCKMPIDINANPRKTPKEEKKAQPARQTDRQTAIETNFIKLFRLLKERKAIVYASFFACE